ncbi:hypothetical protein UP17_01680 [Peribacillus simplex]|nr:hypothetical protein UP17_01680 [Peribacillus simplex]
MLNFFIKDTLAIKSSKNLVLLYNLARLLNKKKSYIIKKQPINGPLRVITLQSLLISPLLKGSPEPNISVLA